MLIIFNQIKTKLKRRKNMKLKYLVPWLPGVLFGAACITAGILASIHTYDYFMDVDAK